MQYDESPGDYQTVGDYRATIAKNHQRLSRIRKIKIRFSKLTEKFSKTGAEIFRKPAGNRAENEELPERGGPFSALPAHLEAAERRGRRARMASRTRTDGAGRAIIGGAVYLPSRGIKRAHGACGGSRGYAAPRASRSRAHCVGHAGGCAPSRGGGRRV